PDQSSSGSNTASVSEPAPVADVTLTSPGFSVNLVQNQLFDQNNVLMTFYDSKPDASAGNFTATIDWGNGQITPTPGTVRAHVGGGFDVLSNRAVSYSQSGSYVINVQVTDLLQGFRPSSLPTVNPQTFFGSAVVAVPPLTGTWQGNLGNLVL